jgi:hypothetical protein
MWRGSLGIALLAVGMAALSGCSTDVAKEMSTNTATRAKVMATIASNPEMAGAMMDHMMIASDTTRAVVVERMMSNIIMKQAMTSRMSKDPAMMDRLVSMAVAGDSTMHAHMKELIGAMMKGMDGKRR